MSSKTQTTATKEEAMPALVPKLRFPEFQDAEAWEQKEVGDLFQVTRGDVLSMTLVRDEKTEAMPYPVYSSQTKNNGLSGFYSDYLFEDAITWTTDGANAGDVNYRAGKFFCTNVCGVLLSSKGFANPCIAALINSVARKHVSYVGNPKLMNGVMSKIPVPLPPLPEQQKIAECLSSVDELIAAQARKLDALKTHKKGLMQQLFPREGETQPRLRFPEFQNAGEWSKMTLGQAATFYNGRAYKQEELLESGKYPVLRVGNFFTNKNWYYSDLELDDTKYCDDGDLLYAWSASFGPRLWLGGKVIYHYHIWKVEERRGIDRQFLFITLENETERMKTQSANGLGLLHITKGTIEGWETSFPPQPAEQQRIASCLSSLDALITAETQKHEALKTHKKGLMQQLFPSPEEVEA